MGVTFVDNATDAVVANVRMSVAYRQVENNALKSVSNTIRAVSLPKGVAALLQACSALLADPPKELSRP
jgi:hypothetical protein